jgi:hypothetical protein
MGFAAVVALWISGCTISDDLGRIQHPLRYEIEHTGGSTVEIEQVVRSNLLKIEQSRLDLDVYLEENDFRKVSCGGERCYLLVVGWLVTTSVMVAIAPNEGRFEGWRLGDVSVGFTGP